MDELVRGYIEETIDEIIEKEAIFTNIEWIKQEIPIASFRDLALGYIIVGIVSTAVLMIFIGQRRSISDKEKHEIRAMLKGRLSEMLERIHKELQG